MIELREVGVKEEKGEMGIWSYRVFRKNCVHNSLQPLPRLHRCKRHSEVRMLVEVRGEERTEFKGMA